MVTADVGGRGKGSGGTANTGLNMGSLRWKLVGPRSSALVKALRYSRLVVALFERRILRVLTRREGRALTRQAEAGSGWVVLFTDGMEIKEGISDGMEIKAGMSSLDQGGHVEQFRDQGGHVEQFRDQGGHVEQFRDQGGHVDSLEIKAGMSMHPSISRCGDQMGGHIKDVKEDEQTSYSRTVE
ncbi:hypothetical protein VC83_05036 [Pseudogymnoascus destructans]|uniref:Uncharacterized protein n=1 Tax=Pseudogymnoascus destructans TaxID=655981 RepID=A0A177A8M5_9PEZI|nr:uncharacterized protein VC83_05036 [Pseudogymnoascus destructans]OAF58518.1 hypothetical protein VC83_05036 [Pseudogymnoascus destructans]